MCRHVKHWGGNGRIRRWSSRKGFEEEKKHVEMYLDDPQMKRKLMDERCVCLEESCMFQGPLGIENNDSFIKHAFLHHHIFGWLEELQVTYCVECLDIVYIPEFETQLCTKYIPRDQLNGNTSLLKRKRNREDECDEWIAMYGYKHVTSLKVTPTTGLCGLLNMGNTCFMNAILQSLVHVPMILHYFLADQHNNKSCPRDSNFCLCCNMDKLILEMYTPRTELAPIVPYNLLYAMWNHADFLAGYRQQDGHEFLISLLDGIHSHSRLTGASPRVGAHGINPCDCIIHQTFAGALRSDIVCNVCNSVSSAYDPILDLSVAVDANDIEPDVHYFLNRFTSPEAIEARCSKCNKNRDCKKTLSIQMPPNRFDTLTQSKVSTHITFPTANLNISAYVANPLSPRYYEFAHLFESMRRSSPPCTDYDLVAVVNHHGTLHSGHYTSFGLHKNTWYLFDDSTVEAVPKSRVLESQA
ncbi:ubiquitin carboxylterminal hydrolase 22 [Thraustotheca clavata]|uniref:Ubiquitin carboxyl-terminal hydrolase n=1 Tax=Thraustotheca clavata TaxID=74557 RepID=A0A1V9ZF83_9STRA|nr:ubiquitin carboxylterminal hydrolase 22 [Thraustotheca clavata]